MRMATLAGYSVLITGASEGLGRGIALAAASAGAAVAVTGRALNFVIGPARRFVSGQTLIVSGGAMML